MKNQINRLVLAIVLYAISNSVMAEQLFNEKMLGLVQNSITKAEAKIAIGVYYTGKRFKRSNDG
jgi:hypothetical protein